MSRIRSIHPGLFTDEAFMTLTVEAPLAVALLIGLWCEADDSGHFEWKPLTLKARILPAASSDVKWLLEALCGANVVKRFELAGKHFGVIRNFVKFQRPKEPKDIHPSSVESRAYAGFTSEGTRPRSTTGRPPKGNSAVKTGRPSEPLPKSPRSPSERARQREEEGGRREDVGCRMEDEGGAAGASAAPPPSASADQIVRDEYTRVEWLCREAAGVGSSPEIGLQDISPIMGLIRKGASLESEILPAMRFKPHPTARNWKYFVPQIREFRTNLQAAALDAPIPFPRAGPKPEKRNPWIEANEQILREQREKTDDFNGTDFNGTTIDAAVVEQGSEGDREPSRRVAVRGI
jgi:hypothetical protein